MEPFCLFGGTTKLVTGEWIFSNSAITRRHGAGERSKENGTKVFSSPSWFTVLAISLIGLTEFMRSKTL